MPVQKQKSSRKRKMIYCTFSAMPKEIAKFKQAAAAADRSLSWWIRTALTKAAGIEETNNETQTENEVVEVIPSDGAHAHVSDR